MSWLQQFRDFILHSPYGFLAVIVSVFIAVFFRYVLIAGTAYLLFWKGLRERLHFRRIQQKFPKAAILQQEFLWSLSTFVIFSLVGASVFLLTKHGYTLQYRSISDYGWGYYVLSLVLMILVHDAYFYWTHRWMHHKSVFRYFHRVHHLSHNPSPWAAFSFHPLEAVVEASIIYVFAFTIPHHVSALLIFLIFMTVMNVLGHLGYELYPKGFSRHKISQWLTTSTHHNLHHSRSKGNFSLYFTWWDRWMGTLQPEYHEAYDEVTHRPNPAKAPTIPKPEEDRRTHPFPTETLPSGPLSTT